MKPFVNDLHRRAARIRRGYVPVTNWLLALECVAQDGGVQMQRVFKPRRLSQLRAELAKCPLRSALERIGPVRQRAEVGTLPIIGQSLPAVRGTAAWLSRRLPGSGWRPNEANIMVYSGPGAGITPHRDHRRYILLIAVLSISGIARFRIVANRAGCNVVHDWECKLGDLVLLRAPGLADPVDGGDPRPLHTVYAPPNGRRVSLTFRMDETKR
jgi:hypothetical protein